MTGAPGSGGSETGAPCGDSYLTDCETPMAPPALHTRTPGHPISVSNGAVTTVMISAIKTRTL